MSSRTGSARHAHVSTILDSVLISVEPGYVCVGPSRCCFSPASVPDTEPDTQSHSE